MADERMKHIIKIITDRTGCTYLQGKEACVDLLEVFEAEDIGGFNRGYNTGFAEGCQKGHQMSQVEVMREYLQRQIAVFKGFESPTATAVAAANLHTSLKQYGIDRLDRCFNATTRDRLTFLLRHDLCPEMDELVKLAGNMLQ